MFLQEIHVYYLLTETPGPFVQRYHFTNELDVDKKTETTRLGQEGKIWKIVLY